MRPVLQDVLDAVAELEPKHRWTTSVTYWQDGTMQLVTSSTIAPAGHAWLRIEAQTLGSISDETVRRHLRKIEASEFRFLKGPLFPGTARWWALKACLRLLAWTGDVEAADALLEKLEAVGFRTTKGEA